MGSLYDSFPFKLRSAVWEITLACCFNCAYCGSGGGKARPDELTLSECVNVAEQLKRMGTRRVSLIGGEIFMRPDWREITHALTSRGIKVCVITNGFLMTREIVSSLISLNIESVAVSVDGPPEVHDKYRQKGSYERAFRTIETLLTAGIHVSVISALRADNYRLLPEFYETLKNYGIFAWQLQACSPMGNADKNKIDVRFDPSFVTSFVASVKDTAPFAVGVADNIGYYSPEEGGIRGVNGFSFSGCGAGLTSVGIDSLGNVRGCESMYDDAFNEGNLRKRSLEDIWTDPNAFSYNRKFTPDLLEGGCSGCEYGDVCAGGCRSYNYFTTGSLYRNPLCKRGNP